MTRERPGPEDLTLWEAKERYLKRRQTDSTESSVGAWHGRLKLFAEWAEDQGVERVGDLRADDVDWYYDHRADLVEPVTLEGEMWTLKKFAEYLEQLGAVDGGFADSVRVPDVDADERSSDVRLDTEAATALLEFYRGRERHFGTRAHALLDLAWTTGARQSGLRALDVRDLHADRGYVEFLHRPASGTGLKKNSRGERAVAIPEETVDALETFVDEYRYDVYDDQNRQPLLASRSGRPTGNTVRVWMYLATLPCQHSPCPHGREREGCQFTDRNHASKCPSSRAPHHVRTGSISWQLDRGIPAEIVAERVNAAVSTIRDHYDKTGRVERMEKRRRNYLTNLSL